MNPNIQKAWLLTNRVFLFFLGIYCAVFYIQYFVIKLVPHLIINPHRLIFLGSWLLGFPLVLTATISQSIREGNLFTWNKVKYPIPIWERTIRNVGLVLLVFGFIGMIVSEYFYSLQYYVDENLVMDKFYVKPNI